MIQLFQQYVPKSFLWLSLSEFLIFLGSVFAGHHMRVFVGDQVSDVLFESLLSKALIFAIVTFIAALSMGLYQRRLREGLNGIAIRIGAASLISFAVLGLLFYAWPMTSLGRGELLIAFALTMVVVVIWRAVFFRFFVDSGTLKRRVMVLGAGERAARVTHFRRKSDQLTFTVVGFVQLEGDSDTVSGDLLLDRSRPLPDLAAELQVDELVVAADDRRKGLPVDELLKCKMNGVDVVDLLTFFEREHGIIKLDILHPSWLIYSEGFRKGQFRSLMKRVFDIFSSLLLLSLAWPLMVIGALAVWLESGFKGPVLYRQTRIGADAKPFKLMKFRSMRTDAEADGVARWASKNDSRVTWVGSLLRPSRIDELPQIFNVLRGDMSFVGPRPERPEFVESLTKEIPFYVERHRVKPGITGWAQVCYPYGASESDAFQKLQFDLYYVKNYTVFLDLWILLQTAEVVVWSRGAR